MVRARVRGGRAQSEIQGAEEASAMRSWWSGIILGREPGDPLAREEEGSRRHGGMGMGMRGRKARWGVWLLVAAAMVQHADTGTGAPPMEWVGRRLSQEFASTIKKAPPPGVPGGGWGVARGKEEELVCEPMSPPS